MLRKRKRLTAAAIAAAVLIVGIVTVILITSLHVPEPSELKLESSASSQILTWNGNPTAVSYMVYKKESGKDFELAAQIPLGGECSFVSSGLKSATPYEYRVVAVKGSGENARESDGMTVSAYTLPETPEAPSALTMSKDSLTVSWTNSQPISGYEINYGTSADLSDASLLKLEPSEVETDAAANRESFLIPNLTVGTTYYFAVRCFCGEDVFSEWTDVFSGTVTHAVDMTGIDVSKPMVALTFDDGPDKGDYTYRILDTLKNYGAHATFFQLGQLAEIYPDVVKRIVDEGNEIGCHTYDHTHMGNAVTQEDIVRGNDAIENTCGVRPTVFRAPGGELTDQIRSVCESQGQAIYCWNVDSRDWQSRDADAIMTEIESQGVGDGDIILMHNIYESSAAATERLVPWLIQQGYQVVTASQLIQAKTGQPPVPGTQYFSSSRSN